ncbi:MULTISPECIES: sugar phosphate isomerase/epimerase [unclassified Mucilaginibacter]|uniref:sugar phosphate isomerase/epimerase family protein n=1 Tax=unclassified Mucilaginibacter TaxID=2617802 RepID=UPI002AC9C15D|nr:MULTISPECIES: sugar phosphate isomerase/epimerase [unclassified Mucilaginibacter]MEB0262741.1 sugar phosphate isomerase/epimerase [Mucilaginibacter sp. 10I4]MEB0279512.1 sugar phosphate isomerase/epimerase [Mucilaginibacter sp. 10B2]MEB0302548.1 sugar phosphate isomerase/epimerase [Mucilaginibacter sp. 5C4]WPX22620.1 sugar phosphate isomerase/epimerase [Mucilaginibacter sp. 5C4]
MTSRRTFLAQAGLASAGMVLAPSLLSAKSVNGVGIQLYSLRDQLPKDPKGVLAKIAEAGYKEVETFGYSKQNGFWGLSAKEFSTVLKANGLKTPSGHYGMDEFFGTGKTDVFYSYIEAAHATGQNYIVIPSLNHDFIKTAADFNSIADKMNKAAEVCKKEGLKLGYHNHNFEWEKVEGTTFYDTILAKTDPKLVAMEMDIYWVVRAGHDPVSIFKKHPGRFAMVHIKDMDKTNPELNTEIGSGSIDFKTILAKAKLAGIKHYLVEQENFTNIDPYKSIAQSSAYLKNKLYL